MKIKNCKGMGMISALLVILIFIAVLTAAYIALTKTGIDIEEMTMPEIQENITEEVEEKIPENYIDMQLYECDYNLCDDFEKCEGETMPSLNEDECCKGKCIPPTDEEIEEIRRMLYS